MDTINKIKKAVKQLKAGNVIVVADAPNREAECDLVGSAQLASPAIINTVIKEARGVLCAPLTRNRAEQLHLNLMVKNNTEKFNTKFLVSLDSKKVSTGVSPLDRAQTLNDLADGKNSSADFENPGHIFPLMAEGDGVLARTGHTEASVDMMKIAGLSPVAFICEAIQDNGEMYRYGDAKQLAEKLDTVLITVADIRKYRYLVNDGAIAKLDTVDLPTPYGDFTLTDYESTEDGQLQLVLKSKKPSDSKTPLVRLHSECFTGDVLGSKRCDCGEQLTRSLQLISKHGGYLIYLRQEGRGIGLKDKLKTYKLQQNGVDTYDANVMLDHAPDEREYLIAAAILKDMGINNIQLLTNNPDKIAQLQNLGITISQRVPLEMPKNGVDDDYLTTKKNKFNHLLKQI